MTTEEMFTKMLKKPEANQMASFRTPLLMIALLLCGCSIGSASPILDGWLINIDGIFISFNDVGAQPATSSTMNNGGNGYAVGGGATAYIANGTFDAGSIDYDGGGGQTAGGMGLGQIAVSVMGTGTHTVSVWIDHHLEFGNGPVFFNEYGTVVGTPGVDATYTIDEPGYGDPNGYQGAGFANTLTGTLDNTNHLPVGGLNSPSDVSMALSQTYTVVNGAFGAKFRFFLNYSGADYLQPGFFLPSGFHLEQNSIDGSGTLYFSSTVEDIPEPAGWSLAAGGALMLVAMFFRRQRNSGLQLPSSKLS